jgi:6-phospho-beta-glucosidase
MRIAVIGAGSTYTPELVAGLARERDRLGLDRLSLHDIDQGRRDVVGAMARRMLDHAGYAGVLDITGDLDAAIDGADFVLVQIRVGGQAARHQDETIPLACGCVGQETTGAGGFAKAMRTVPVMLEIADRVRERAASDAWIVDFTNPVGIVTRALLDHGHRACGLCNVAIGFQRWIAARLQIAPERVAVGQVGLNHLTWIRSVEVDGEDILDRLLADSIDDIAAEIEQPARLIADLGVIPSYYLKYFYCHDKVVAAQHGQPTRAQEVQAIEAGLLEMYRDPALVTKPALLEQRGGAFYSEAATQLVSSLHTGDGSVQVVDVRNDGALPGLADDDVVELPARIGVNGPEPLPQEPLPADLLGLVQHVAAYERMAVAAAIDDTPVARRRALLAHPLIGQDAMACELAETLFIGDRARV